MSVRIITDSASDISQEWAKEWNITVLPLKVRFGYTGFSDETLKKYIHDSARLYEDKIDVNDSDKFRIAKVGATIGTYAGPGAIAVAFFAR